MAQKKHRDIWREIYSDEESRKQAFPKRWERLDHGRKILWIVLGLFLFVTVFSTILWTFFEQDVANIFGIFFKQGLAIILSAFTAGASTVVAIIALISSNMQAKYSRIANRNDRFAKATEMLGSNKSLTSQGGGLYMLRELVKEKPETEYIRCVEAIANWLREGNRNIIFARIGIETFTAKKIDNLPEEKRKKIIDKHKDEYRIALWPDFRGANLQGVSLRDADLEDVSLENTDLRGASLAGANLKDAVLTNAKLAGSFIRGAKIVEAIGLEPEQILLTTWKRKEEKHISNKKLEKPKLPSYLMDNTEVEKWLDEPPFLYKYKGK